MDGTRSGLWSEYAKAIDALRPSLVVIENVRGLLSAKTIEDADETVSDLESGSGGVGELGWGDRPVLNAFGRVLGDLAVLGYDAEWAGLRAADAGAPHGRFRVFILARAADSEHVVGYGTGRAWDGWPEPANGTTADTGRMQSERWGGHGNMACTSGSGEVDRPERKRDGDAVDHCGSTATDAERCGRNGRARETGREQGQRAIAAGGGGVDWGTYSPAIERWEAVTGRPAPAPTLPDGRNGGHRLSAPFVEWMMGLDVGHVTSPAIGLTRNEQLKALGNGVVPQQAALAVRVLLDRMNSKEQS